MKKNHDNLPPHLDLEKVIVSREQIAQRIVTLADELTRFYQGKELTIVMVLTGALIFVSDLVRQINLKLRIEPVSISSYPGKSTATQGCKFRLPPSTRIAGRHVLIVDDIYDSGKTMAFLEDALREAGAADVHSCVLLRKQRADLPDRPGEVHFVGFDIPDEFVVGYGLDFDDLYRNLPDVGVLAEHAR